MILETRFKHFLLFKIRNNLDLKISMSLAANLTVPHLFKRCV